jgi:tripartite-type tricarboxylate transporter receptor subunit TctC
MKKIISLIFMLLSTQVLAEPLWNKTIRVYVSSSVGGTNDLATRIVMTEISRNINVPIIVTNNNTASGIVATRIVSNAAPDGYNWLSNFSQYTTASSYFESKINYSKLKGVATFSTTNLVLVTNNQFKTLQDLKNANRILFKGCVGNGSPGCVYNDLFAMASGLEAKTVNYSTTSNMNLDISNGTLDFAFNTPNNVKGLAAEKLVNVYDMNSLKEIGFDTKLTYWTGLLTGVNTPNAYIIEMEKQIYLALQKQEVLEKFKKIDIQPMYIGSGDFNKLIEQELVVYGNLKQTFDKD